MPLATRHKTLFGAKHNGTTSATNLGSPNHLDDLGEQTIISVCRENGDHGGNLGYLYSKGAGGAGPRFMLGSTVAGQTRTGLGFHSSGSSTNPFRAGTVGEYVRGEHLFIAGTWDGSLNATGINIYLSRNGSTSKEVTYGTSTNGVTAVAADAAETVFVGNRSDSLRTVNGDIHYVAVCKGRLSYTQIETVRQHGPFAVNADWRLIFSNGIDYSPYNTRPASITALGLGRNSPYPFFKRQSVGVEFSVGGVPAAASNPIEGAGSGKYNQRGKNLSEDEVWEYVNYLKESFRKKPEQQEALQATYTELAAEVEVARDYSDAIRKQLMGSEFARMQAELNDLELAIRVRDKYEKWKQQEEEMELILLVA